MEFQKWFAFQKKIYPEATLESGKRIFEDDRLRNSICWLEEELGLSDDEICVFPLGLLLFVGGPERIGNVRLNVERLLYSFSREEVFLLLVDYPVAFVEEPSDFDEAIFEIMLFVGSGWQDAIMGQLEGDRDHSIFREMIGRTLYPESWFAALEQLGDYLQPVEAE